MPELPHFNPSVSVFHFNAKVSNAKIAKYRAATERGMVASQALPAQPPAKRPRLRLSVRNPSTEDDTITVSRSRAPLPTSKSGKKRAWNNAFAKDGDPAARPSPTPSSDLSSADSEIIAAATSVPTSKSAEYGDFMSYYVMDDDDEVAPNAAVDVPKKTRSAKQPTVRPSKNPASRHSHPAAPAPPTLPPQQTYPMQGLPPAAIDIRLREPDPIPVMILKLEALSSALTDFGGGPAIPPSPGLKPVKTNVVTNLLAMFGGLGDDEEETVDYFEDLEQPGVADQSLTHGIEFIMNALKSWAEQRIATMRMQVLHGSLPVVPRRASGKSKGSSTDSDMTLQEMQAAIPNNLFETPEGRAISAFRSAVESGCLRVNAKIPVKLSRALRHLYMQIDGLINQTPKNDPPWRCLSYTAQIEANRVRVDSWKNAQAKAQEEMIRQHQLAHQQIMRQLGIPIDSTAHMFYHHSQDADAIAGERRRQSQDLVRLPLHPQPNAAKQATTASSSGVVTVAPEGQSLPRSKTVIGSAHRDPSSAAFLPRSGQSMKFSFAPSNKAALEIFGVQAFPTGQGTSTDGKNGRMSMTTPTKTPNDIGKHAHPAGKATSTPVAPGFSAINKQAV